MTDGKGQKTTYSYDGDDRITQVLTNGATTCSYSSGTCVTYGHDDNGNQTSMRDATGLTQYAFDVMNRQTTKTLPSSATLTLGYDHAGNVASYTDAGGTVAYGHNAANQLTSLAEPGGSCTGTISLCTTFGLNNNGQRTSTSYPGGTVMSTTLDNSGRPTEVKAVNGSSVISDFTYTYTKSGSDTELAQTRVDVQAGLTTSYGYDALDELRSAVEKNGGGSTTAAWRYCYDNAGNRTQTSTSASGTATCSTSPTTSYGYNTANELTSLNGSSTGWSYDANGNETSGNSAIPRTSETYSASDQLLSGSASGTSFSATYAGLSNDERVTTTAAGTTDTYQNGPDGLAVEDCGCGATYYFTRDPGGALASERAGSSHYYYIFDGLGSVVALVNSSGTAVDTFSYDPYGQSRTSTGTTNNPFGYISGFDDGTGLYHLGARYYDPALGRFTQQDPANQQPNLYTYGADSPVNAVDPNGTNAFSDFFTKTIPSAFSDAPHVLSDLGSALGACFAGGAALEEAVAPAQPLIAVVPGGGEVVESAVPLIGCAAGAYSDYVTGGFNALKPEG